MASAMSLPTIMTVMTPEHPSHNAAAVTLNPNVFLVRSRSPLHTLLDLDNQAHQIQVVDTTEVVNRTGGEPGGPISRRLWLGPAIEEVLAGAEAKARAALVCDGEPLAPAGRVGEVRNLAHCD